MLRLGTMTRWGKIGAIMWLSGERYYMMSNGECVSLMPETVVVASLETKAKG